MIRVVTHRSGNKKGKNSHSLFVHGREVPQHMIRWYSDDPHLHLEVQDMEMWRIVRQFSFRDLPEQIDTLSNRDELDGIPFGLYSWFDNKGVHADLSVELNLRRWVNPFAYVDYMNEIKKTAEAENVEVSFFDDPNDVESLSETPGFFFGARLVNQNSIIGDIYDQLLHDFKHVHFSAISTLNAPSSKGTLAIIFDFPDEVRTACEQYLLYFAEFLRNVGVEATTEVQHSASTTLFSVTPKHQDQALENIRRALEIYLHLPGASNINLFEVHLGEPHIQQLLANIQHLKGQLLLAGARLEAQDVFIDRLLANRSRRELPSTILTESRAVEPARSDGGDNKEVMLGGIFALGTWKKAGFEVNWAEIFRRLREMFRKESGDSEQS